MYTIKTVAFGHVIDYESAYDNVYKFYRWCKTLKQKQEFLASFRSHIIDVAGHKHGINQPVNTKAILPMLEVLESILRSL